MKKVLIFDDNQDILEMCTIILQAKGFVTATELNCKNLLEKVQTYSPDLILMDFWIQGMNGAEAIQLLKRTASTLHIPVILFSANNNIEIVAKEARADFFLKKPFNISELIDLISTAIEKDKN